MELVDCAQRTELARPANLMNSPAFPTLAGSIATVLVTVSATAQRPDAPSRFELDELVYRLADPRGRILVQERLLVAGRRALPRLVRAIVERNFKNGHRSWNTQNRIPELAQLTGEQIKDQAVAAALRVVQEMGSTARSALPQLLGTYSRSASVVVNQARANASVQENIYSAIHAIALASDQHKVLQANPDFVWRIGFHSQTPTEDLVDFLAKPDNQTAGSWFRAACELLAQRRAQVLTITKLRKRLLRVLETIIANNPADASVWPTLGSPLIERLPPAETSRAGEVYSHTLTHDIASLLLAGFDSSRPLAMRGNMMLLADIRRETRLRAAIALGRLGATAAPAQFCLINRLLDPAPKVRQAAIASIGTIGPKARATVVHLRLLAHGSDKTLSVLAKAALRSVDPRPSDIWTYYHYNGNRQAEGQCKGTTKVGPWMFWRADGSPLWAGTYVNGKMHGRWRYWIGADVWIYEYHMGTRKQPAR